MSPQVEKMRLCYKYRCLGHAQTGLENGLVHVESSLHVDRDSDTVGEGTMSIQKGEKAKLVLTFVVAFWVVYRE